MTHKVSFSNAWLAALGMSVLSNERLAPLALCTLSNAPIAKKYSRVMSESNNRNATFLLKQRAKRHIIIGHGPYSTKPVLIEPLHSAVTWQVDNFVDYYELLHVQPSAPAAVIKASYRTMLQKLNHHPDRGGDVAFAQLLNAAATTLCNPKARAHYDQLRQQQLAEDKAAQTRANGKQHEWGEPGGSPAGSRNPSSDKKEQPEYEASDTSQKARTKPQRDVPAAAPLSLPTKPQCPFCLSPYPPSNPGVLAAKGYTNINRCQVCNAARTPIAQVPEASSNELRRMHRRHHETPAKLWPYWPASTPADSILTDFSPAGCALTSVGALTHSDVVMLETELFNAICNVRHCKPSGSGQYAIGLEFLTLDMLARPGTLFIASA